MEKNYIDIYKLGPMQEGILFHHLYDRKDDSYVIQVLISINGHFIPGYAEKAYDFLIKQYDVLRTSIVYNKMKIPRQVLLKAREGTFIYKDISLLSHGEQESFIDRYIEDDRSAGFDITKDILFRVTCIKKSSDAYLLMFTHHHIILDGLALGIVCKDFLSAYKKLTMNQPLPVRKIYPYRNYIEWLESRDKEAMFAYWKHYLQGYDAIADIPLAMADAKEKGSKRKEYYVSLGPDLSGRIKEFANTHGVTLNNVMQTIWGIILQRYNNKNDVVFGNVVSLRAADLEGIESMAGLLINTIPLRVHIKEDTTFIDLLKGIQQDFLESLEYNHLTLTDIQKCSSLNGPLFSNIYAYEDFAIENDLYIDVRQETNDFSISNVKGIEQSNYDFNILIFPGEDVRIKFIYNGNRLDNDFIARIGGHIIQVVNELLKNPTQKAARIEIVTRAEKERILYKFNDTKTHYPSGRLIHELFGEVVMQMPEATALVYKEKKLTYRELHDRSNRIACLLAEKKCRKGAAIGLSVNKSIEMVVGMLGILKAGAAYVPIEPSYPENRIKFILKDICCDLLLSQKKISENLKTAVDIINLDDELLYESASESGNPGLPGNADDLAYILFTSGSTGTPKGVLVPHRAVVRLVRNTNYTRFERGGRILQTGAIAFDASTFEIWGALLNGLELHLVDDDIILNGRQMGNIIKNNGITTLWLTSSLFNQLCLEDPALFKPLHTLLVGGEALNPQTINLVRETNPGLVVINGYGPTENTTFSTFFKIEKDFDASIPIGKPISNSTAYILDQYNNVQPVGVAGELCVGGDGVARGYLNDPDLTSQKFVPHPFEPGATIYRTGDLARWMPDGNIDFLGRRDYQVKIRGYRIEPGEIEAALRAINGIKDALVVTIDENGHKNLCSYIIADAEVKNTDIITSLKMSLPSYLVPAYIIKLDSFPKTKSGKIDRYSLPDPRKHLLREGTYTAPQTEVQKNMAEIWQNILGVERIGITDDFFMFGGDSIKVIQVVSQLQRYGYTLEVHQFFENRTIEELSGLVTHNANEIDQGKVTGNINFTPIQHWFREKVVIRKNHFNQALMFYRPKGFDRESVRGVFRKLLRHHDALRIVLSQDNGYLINKDTAGPDVPLTFHEVPDGDMEALFIREKAEEIQKTISLHNGPLLHLGLFRTATGDHLLIVIHHLVIDGISWRILLEDFSILYDQEMKGQKAVLPLKTHSFKYWAEALTGYSRTGNVKDELPYWQKVCSGYTPLTGQSPVTKGTARDILTSTIIVSKEDTTFLSGDIHKPYHTGMNDILVSALSLALGKWCGKNTIIFNMEGHGRQGIVKDMNITRTIGWFTSLYPVKLDIMENLEDHIRYVKKTLEEIPGKGIGYGVLRYLSGLSPDLKETITIDPDICFNYLGQFRVDPEESGFSLSPYGTGKTRSDEENIIYDLDVNSIIKNGRMEFTFDYNRNVIDRDRIDSFVALFRAELDRIIRHCMEKNESISIPGDFGPVRISTPELSAIRNYLPPGINIEDIYYLTPMQNGILFHHIYDNERSAYTIQLELTLAGKVRPDLLEESYKLLINRNSILRSFVFYEETGQAKLIVKNMSEGDFIFEDISRLSDEEKTAYLSGFRKKDWDRGFDLARDSLLRFHLFKTEHNNFVLLITTHHIIIDGWSLNLLCKELLSIYIDIRAGRQVPDKKYRDTYREYSEWLMKQENSSAMDYWIHYLTGFEPPETPPLIKKRDKTGAYLKKDHFFTINTHLKKSIDALARELKITPNNILQLVWGILLHKYGHNNDIVFGNVISGRQVRIGGIQETIGLFINTIPLRITFGRSDSYKELLLEINKKFIECERHGYIALTDIQQAIGAREGLFDTLFVFENYPLDNLLADSRLSDDLDFDVISSDMKDESNYPVNMILLPNSEEIIVRLSYNEHVAGKELMPFLEKHIIRILDEIINNTNNMVSDFRLFSPDEYETIVKESGYLGSDFYRNGHIGSTKEIRRSLLNHPGIHDCAVLTDEDGTVLVYYVPCLEINTFEIDNFLRNKLAAFYFPLDYIHVQTIPRTMSGKAAIRYSGKQGFPGSGALSEMTGLCMQAGIDDCGIYTSYEDKTPLITYEDTIETSTRESDPAGSPEEVSETDAPPALVHGA
ncbi:MAG: amino acid adenylation domain-containing protein, partial [Spirochaetales bacterium]|nr:amino acid adenylation domain-containing protein [Spirochaetales bacterium]